MSNGVSFLRRGHAQPDLCVSSLAGVMQTTSCMDKHTPPRMSLQVLRGMRPKVHVHARRLYTLRSSPSYGHVRQNSVLGLPSSWSCAPCRLPCLLRHFFFRGIHLVLCSSEHTYHDRERSPVISTLSYFYTWSRWTIPSAKPGIIQHASTSFRLHPASSKVHT